MKRKLKLTGIPILFLAFAVVACGGGGGGSDPAATYTVTYDANGATGGIVPVDSTTYEETQMVTVIGNTGSLVKDHFAFAGWNTAADGSGTNYAPGQQFQMGSANVTLYVKWVLR
jgi:hypothetical protein